MVAHSEILGPLSSSNSPAVDIIEISEVNGYVKPKMEQQRLLKWERSKEPQKEDLMEPPWYVALFVQLAFSVMISFAVLTEWLLKTGLIQKKAAVDDPRHKGFASLREHFEALYINHIVRKFSDVISRPLCGVPGSIMTLKDRYSDDEHWTYKMSGTTSEVINLGSYNYLGFSHNDGPCAENAARYIDNYGLHIGGSKHETGNHVVHRDMEKCIAQFLGVEDAVCFPMGFGTNTMNIPSLVNKDSLILSDALNHSSIALGCRMSGATIKVFKHNEPANCEKILRDALCQPSPKTGKPYNKILILIEGIYSMEGTIVNLPEFIKIKKKYGAYLFLDEAHSIGALGPTGRGVVEYWGCSPKDVDVMMGTLTKSFAAAGGYMGGTKEMAAYIRSQSAGPCYGIPMSPPIMAQVLSSMEIMSGEDGTDIGETKAVQLLRNSRYFRKRLSQMGFLVYGHDDSPVVPLMTFYITKVVEFSRLTLKRNVGLVAVGYPATPPSKARVRFCLSADHTKEQLDEVLEIVNEIGDMTGTKYGTKKFQGLTIEY